MKHAKLLIAIMSLSLIFAASIALAGTKAESEALLDKAVALVEKNGDKAFIELQDKNGPYVKEDLYVYIFEVDTFIVRVHPMKPAMIGKFWKDLNDAYDTPFVQEINDGAKSKGSGNVIYSWTNPTTKKLEEKCAAYKKVGKYIIICGYYL
jgi:cytochrome c